MKDTNNKTDSKRNPSSISKIEFITMSLLRKEIVKPDGFTGKFYRIFKKEMRQILHKVKKKEGILANLFNEATQTR